MRLNKNSSDLLLISLVFLCRRNSLEKHTENSGVLLNCQRHKSLQPKTVDDKLWECQKQNVWILDCTIDGLLFQ